MKTNERNATDITALVGAYRELSNGADVSLLTPSQITAYISDYMQAHDVDTSRLTPDGITAFVLAYEEVQSGASTSGLTADGLTAYVSRYAEENGIADVSGLTPQNVTALVSAYRELESGADITVNGSGDITLMVGTTIVTLMGVEDSITIDTPFLEAYKGIVSQNTKMSGDFPILMPGANAINWTGDVSSVVVTPNWRNI